MTAVAHRRRQRGLSLLELLVALSIMAMAVGMLYRVIGSNVRNVGMLQDQQKAVLLAQSLLEANDTIAGQGSNQSGQSAGYEWQVSSRPYDAAPMQSQPGATRLFLVQIAVRWSDGGQPRSIELRTLRPERGPVVSAGSGP